MADKKPLTKSQIYTQLAETTGLQKKQVDEFIIALNNLAYKETKRVGRFTLPGIGILKLQKRKARMGRNPATGESIRIKASKKVGFRPAKELKEAI